MAALTLRLVKGSPLTHGEADDNFTNLNNELATKLNSSSYTASDVLAKLLTVGGAGSGLDADLLDGQSSAYYTDIPARLGYTPQNAAGYTAADVRTKLLTVDGAGSGIDADLLDGVNGATYARQDTVNTFTALANRFSVTPGQTMASATGALGPLEVYQASTSADAFMSFHVSGDYAIYFGLDGTTNDLAVGGWSMGAVKHRVWHAGNDGPGSGLDADTVDGRSYSESVVGNTIVSRDSNGYINVAYINAATSNNENPTISQFITDNGDGYFRKSSAAHAAARILALMPIGAWLTGTDGSERLHFASGSRNYYKSGDGTHEFRNASNGAILNGTSAGDWTAAGNLTANSDERLKEDWASLPGNLVESLSGVRMGSYTRIDTGARQVGVSAQSLRRVMPEAVLEGEGGILSVAYGNAALVASVALARRVIDLERRLAALESA
jgi:hypothetical protein